MKLPWWLEPMGTRPASITNADSPPVTKLNPPPAPTTLAWIDSRRPTAADAMPDGEVQYLIGGTIIGLAKWHHIAAQANMDPWTHCPGWSEPEVPVPSDKELTQWVGEFITGNAAGKSDCASIVAFIAKRTPEWIAEQRKRGQ